MLFRSRPLPGGHRSAVWLVQSASGLVVAKSTKHGKAALEWLAPVQQAARAAGFIVPHLHRTVAGDLRSQGWMVEDWVEGHPFAAADMARLHAQVRAFHKSVPAMPQRPGFASLPARILGYASDDPDLAALPSAIAALCLAAWQPFVATPTHAIHGDITAANLIHTPTGPALIDWDEARVDLPFLDFVHLKALPRNQSRAHLAHEVVCSWQVEPDYARDCARRLSSPPFSV